MSEDPEIIPMARLITAESVVLNYKFINEGEPFNDYAQQLFLFVTKCLMVNLRFKAVPHDLDMTNPIELVGIWEAWANYYHFRRITFKYDEGASEGWICLDEKNLNPEFIKQ